MDKSVLSSSTAKPRRKIFRKQLILPAEHGSWSWLLVPYSVGIVVAGTWNLAAFLVLLGGLAGFMMRQPATVAMRVRAGRGRKADGRTALAWTIFFGAIALACLLGLLALGRSALLWLLIPMAGIFVFYLLASRQQRATVRTLWMELAGALGLSAMAPSAYVAATGQLDNTAWALWALTAGQNGLGVLYVRLRIADTHDRDVDRKHVVWVHGLVLLGAVAGATLEAIPWLAVVPFAGFLIRAIWAVAQVRPVANIKRFGFSEIGAEILGGLFIAAGYIL